MERVIAEFLETYAARQVFTRNEVVNLILDMVSANLKDEDGIVQEERTADVRVAESVS